MPQPGDASILVSWTLDQPTVSRTMFRTLSQPGVWAITLSAAGILMVPMGARQSLGLFLSPLNTTTGLGVASISLAMAVGQFTWGAIQPLAGAVADRYGPGRVLFGGLLLLALGSAITPLMSGTVGLIVSLGLFSAIGSGAGSFSVLIGASSQRLPLDARAAASLTPSISKRTRPGRTSNM